MSKSFLKQIGAVALIAGAQLLSANAHAAAVTASAGIFDISGTLLEFSNNQYLSDASTPLHSGFDASSTLQYYYFNDTPSFASIDNAFDPAPMTSAGAINNGYGTATVLWSFDWVATGTGTASFTADYLYSATVVDYHAGESAVASASISALVEGTQNKTDLLYYFNNQNGNTFGNQFLTLNFDVVAGQTGTISVVVASNALAAPAVPVPAAAWLMGSALLGLGGVARKRARKI